MSPRIFPVPPMVPSRRGARFSGDGGTISAMALPRRVMRTGVRVFRTYSRTAQQVALNSVIGISFIATHYHRLAQCSASVYRDSAAEYICTMNLSAEHSSFVPCSWIFVLVAALMLPLAKVASAQAGPDPWLIVASGEKGSINAHTTREDLVRMYGSSNVADQDVDIGDGEMQSGTFLFSKDPECQLEILWKDPETKIAPKSADILGKKSRWHAAHGIALGTSASELERLNGRPFRFTLANDGTDMAEELISWRGGSLEKEFQGDGRVILELEWAASKGAKHRGPHDIVITSDSPVWRAQNPHVSRMSWIFPSDTRP